MLSLVNFLRDLVVFDDYKKLSTMGINSREFQQKLSAETELVSQAKMCVQQLDIAKQAATEAARIVDTSALSSLGNLVKETRLIGTEVDDCNVINATIGKNILSPTDNFIKASRVVDAASLVDTSAAHYYQTITNERYSNVAIGKNTLSPIDNFIKASLVVDESAKYQAIIGRDLSSSISDALNASYAFELATALAIRNPYTAGMNYYPETLRDYFDVTTSGRHALETLNKLSSIPTYIIEPTYSNHSTNYYESSNVKDDPEEIPKTPTAVKNYDESGDIQDAQSKSDNECINKVLTSSLEPNKASMSAIQPLKIFYSYSHKDTKLRKKLEKHLKLLERRDFIINWHDRKIEVGDEWKSTLDKKLMTADIILLLISADFLASDYCYDIEVTQAMKQHEEGISVVIPIMLRSCDSTGASFMKLQGLPINLIPVTKWKDRDEAFTDIAVGLRAIVEEIRKKRNNH